MKWEQLTEEITWEQTQLNGVRGLQGPCAEAKKSQMQFKLNGLPAARTELKSAPARVTTLKSVLQRVEVKKEKAMEQLVEAESALVEAQMYVATCRSMVDSQVAEMISVQQRLDQALFEIPVEQPQGDQVQACMANSMALANAAMASACITQHEQE